MSEFIFAIGPNGAGKSSLAQYIAPDQTVIINGDQIRGESKTLQEAEQKTINLIEGALILKRPIYYESNFLDPRDRDFYISFRHQGYRLQMVYFGLNSVNESIQRVAQRTDLGGHYVDLASIELNYKHGLRNAISFYRDFDSVLLIDNPVAKNSRAEIVFASEKGNEIFKVDKLPSWSKSFIFHVNNPTLPLPFAEEIDEYRRRGL